MEPRIRHAWDLTPRQAIALQRDLARQVSLGGKPPKKPFLVAGCDASGSGRWSRRDERLIAGVLVFRYPGFEIVDHVSVSRPSPFPYIPGLLSFREAPLYAEALQQLKVTPDLLLCDGQGIAHPRGLGLASHLGVLFDLPSIGVAKSRLVGKHREPGRSRGCSTRLLINGTVVGRVLRTRTGVRPLYISPGHRIGVEEAAEAVLAMATRYRLPEPTRAADIWVGQLRRGTKCAPQSRMRALRKGHRRESATADPHSSRASCVPWPRR
ncbi:MAG: endonuclease V [Candidatus Eisenbacteria sp.]|nr:endonuclease V [Candidatus Eisenbacteria bacterium]